MRILFAIAILASASGCGSSTPETSQHPKQAAPRAAPVAAVVLDAGRPGVERRLPLPESEAAWLQKVVSRQPKVQTPSIPLAVQLAVEVNGKRYALEPNELVSFGGPGSQHWHSPGIKKRLMQAAEKHGANNALQPTK